MFDALGVGMVLGLVAFDVVLWLRTRRSGKENGPGVKPGPKRRSAVLATIQHGQNYTPHSAVSRIMSVEEVRAIWLRRATGILLPGQDESWAQYTSGMTLEEFISANDIRTRGAGQCAYRS